MAQELPIEEHAIEGRASGMEKHFALAGGSKGAVEPDQEVLFLLAPGRPNRLG
jgi:hypothetical protein